MTSLSEESLRYLANNSFVVVEDFLTKALQERLRIDMMELRSHKKFQVAKIGRDGMIQDDNTPFRDIRYSETCFIGRTKEPEDTSAPRRELYQILDQVKSVLNTNETVRNGHFTSSIPELDFEMEELMYVYYPLGGYYRRHRDAELKSVSNCRRYSFLIYLNKDWTPNDGGELRIHRDSGGDSIPLGELPNFLDIQPKSGTLVIFRSDMCPHEVLDTYKERLAVVGWFLTSQVPNPLVEIPYFPKLFIHPDTLLALRILRDNSPRLNAKLSPSQNNGNMLMEDWIVPSQNNDSSEVEYPDTDAKYWRKVATFSPTGLINTLSLSGNRLQHLHNEWSPPLLSQVMTLDLGNTDLSVSKFELILSQCTALQHLHMAGNALADSGIANLVPLLKSLTTVDFRYNNITSGESLAGMLQQDSCRWKILHLEGNQLGSQSLVSLVTFGRLKEIYLGQNGIDSDGAVNLAHALLTSYHLKKLHLEGNHIGNVGANTFSEVLEGMENKSLEKLFCDNNGISKKESLRLGRALNSATCIGDGGLYQE
jgi:SM-20-related protein